MAESESLGGLRPFPFSQRAQLRHDFLQSLRTSLLHRFAILVGKGRGRSEPVCCLDLSVFFSLFRNAFGDRECHFRVGDAGSLPSR
jgi:hypothetical protein